MRDEQEYAHNLSVFEHATGNIEPTSLKASLTHFFVQHWIKTSPVNGSRYHLLGLRRLNGSTHSRLWETRLDASTSS